MRSLKAIYTIPAHKSAISDLKFFHAPATANYPTTALPRGLAKLDIFSDSKEGMDVSMDTADANGNGEGAEGGKADFPLSGSFLVSGGYDGMVKIFSADDWQQVKVMSSEGDGSGKVMSVDVSSGAWRGPFARSVTC